MDEQKFTNELIAELGLANLSPELQQQALADFQEALQSKVGLALTNRLDEQQLDAFQKVVEEGTEEQVAAWLDANVPDFAQLADEQMATLKAEIKARVSDRQAPKADN